MRIPLIILTLNTRLTYLYSRCVLRVAFCFIIYARAIFAYTSHTFVLWRCMIRQVNVDGYTLGYVSDSSKSYRVFLRASVVVYMIGYVILFLLIYLSSLFLFKINPKMKKKKEKKRKRNKKQREKKERKKEKKKGRKEKKAQSLRREKEPID